MPAVKTKALNIVRGIFTHKPFERILLSFVRGSKYLGFRTKFIPNPALYKFNSIRTVNRNGINYSLDLSCLMQWYVYWDLTTKDRDQLYSLVREGDIVFDIGTNIGETLLNFAKIVGTKGFVYGFEPDAENYTNVQKNISLNTFKNIHVFNQGVSDKKETVKLFCVEPHNRGMNRILDDSVENNDYSFTTIETDTLDSIVKENGITKVDFIKIDIEGHETHAIKGAVQTLKRFKPVLFIEIGYTRIISKKTTPNELIAILEDLEYSIFHSQTNEKITRSYDFSYVGDGSIDVFALPDKQRNL